VQLQVREKLSHGKNQEKEMGQALDFW